MFFSKLPQISKDQTFTYSKEDYGLFIHVNTRDNLTYYNGLSPCSVQFRVSSELLTKLANLYRDLAKYKDVLSFVDVKVGPQELSERFLEVESDEYLKDITFEVQAHQDHLEESKALGIEGHSESGLPISQAFLGQLEKEYEFSWEKFIAEYHEGDEDYQEENFGYLEGPYLKLSVNSGKILFVYYNRSIERDGEEVFGTLGYIEELVSINNSVEEPN